MPARSVCLVTLSLSEAGPGRFGGQVSVSDIYHTMGVLPSTQPVATLGSSYHTIPLIPWWSVGSTRYGMVW